MKKILSLILVMLLASQMSFAIDGLGLDGTYETDVANEPSVVPVNDYIWRLEGIVARAITSPGRFLVDHEQEFRNALNGLDPTHNTARRLVQRSRAFLASLYPEKVNFEQFVPEECAFFGLF
ncbi:MAG: hypothetical protein LBD98_01460 [Endomicrobium sp.]|jgi:hypothetical protein|nr:hypothetical protein [Endomicrobium sp.]